MPIMTEFSSYRTSHLSKGFEYHAEFTKNPRRALMWSLERRVLDRILVRHFPNGRYDHLDFACGTGRVIAHLQSRANQSVGIDVSASMLAVAGQLAATARLLCADITRDAVLESERFDLITAFRFFPNAEESLRDEAMSALVKRLAPDGLLVFNNHCHSGGLNRRLVRLLKGSAVKLNDMSRQECEDLVARHGLRVSDLYHLGVLPDYETILLRPRWLVSGLERVLQHVPVASCAENLIFVCSRRP